MRRQKSARWIRRTHIFRRDEYECSSCGGRVSKPRRTCPKCGAVMKGSKYDASWADEAEWIDMIIEEERN